MKAIEMFKTMEAEEIAKTIVDKMDSFTDGIPCSEFVCTFVNEYFSEYSDCGDCDEYDCDEYWEGCCLNIKRNEKCQKGICRKETLKNNIIDWLNEEV